MSAQGPSPANNCHQTDSELTQVIDAWGDLPPHIKAAVLALVNITIEQHRRPNTGGGQ